MAITHGMNIEEVEQTGARLKQRSQDLQEIINDLQSRVDQTTWLGADADRFKNDWWPKHKQVLVNMVQELNGLGQSAQNNAKEQRDISA